MPATAPETRASLILRLQNVDDVTAWEEFVEIYAPVVFQVSRARGFQEADADNLVQEVLFAVARSVTKWLERDDRGGFRAWLLSIARNEAAEMFTSKGTRPLGMDGDEGTRMLNALPGRDEISSQLDLAYERAVFQWAADKVQKSVAPQTWQAFWLTRVEGLSVAEAARKLGTRPGNIYFSCSRVMARIKELVTHYEERK